LADFFCSSRRANCSNWAGERFAMRVDKSFISGTSDNGLK
jgi:hypothetical protein